MHCAMGNWNGFSTCYSFLILFSTWSFFPITFPLDHPFPFHFHLAIPSPLLSTWPSLPISFPPGHPIPSPFHLAIPSHLISTWPSLPISFPSGHPFPSPFHLAIPSHLISTWLSQYPFPSPSLHLVLPISFPPGHPFPRAPSSAPRLLLMAGACIPQPLRIFRLYPKYLPNCQLPATRRASDATVTLDADPLLRKVLGPLEGTSYSHHPSEGICWPGHVGRQGKVANSIPMQLEDLHLQHLKRGYTTDTFCCHSLYLFYECCRCSPSLTCAMCFVWQTFTIQWNAFTLKSGNFSSIYRRLFPHSIVSSFFVNPARDILYIIPYAIPLKSLKKINTFWVSTMNCLKLFILFLLAHSVQSCNDTTISQATLAMSVLLGTTKIICSKSFLYNISFILKFFFTHLKVMVLGILCYKVCNVVTILVFMML